MLTTNARRQAPSRTTLTHEEWLEALRESLENWREGSWIFGHFCKGIIPNEDCAFCSVEEAIAFLDPLELELEYCRAGGIEFDGSRWAGTWQIHPKWKYVATEFRKHGNFLDFGENLNAEVYE